MPTDYSRKIFDRKKHYSGVLMQQGRVQLDADWNEQLDIEQYRKHTESIDVIGKSGVPKKSDGFKLSIIENGKDIEIKPGRMYVEGLLCELEDDGTPASYFNQPYHPDPDSSHFSELVILSPPESPPSPPESPASPAEAPEIVLENGIYVAYIEAWQREITQLDDPRIHEVALGTADTTTRLQTVWQVKLLQVEGPPVGFEPCEYPFPEWEELIAPPTGELNARTTSPVTDPDPCLLAESSGYRRLDNQLYRVEIHTGGDRDIATFKWSRDNASVETSIENVSGSVITVNDLAKDEILGFAPNQWVEIIDEESALNHTPNPLLKISDIDVDKREISFSESLVVYEGLSNLKLRKWDETGADAGNEGIEMTGDWIELEGGIEVIFSEGTYNSGDYWLIPARSATHEIEWPPYEVPNVNPIAQKPEGIKVGFAKLGVIRALDGHYVLEDCRKLFPGLTELTAEDILFNNYKCELGEAKTVQDAIDLLCAANDLRRHHKLLHGYGVVCGLQMVCSPDRNNIIVKPGTALDCEGNILDLKRNQPFEIVDKAINDQLLIGDEGKVSVWISGVNRNRLELEMEAYVQKSFWEEILEGSIWKSFYDDCFKDMLDFFKDQFPNKLDDAAPLNVKHKRVTVAINMLVQLINSSTGVYMFLSGIQNQDREEMCASGAEETTEDQILYCFYNRLKELITSENFCGMFDDDQPFPEYTIDSGLDTIFGPPLRAHIHLKLNTALNFAYTYGTDNKIFVYNLERKEYVQLLEFPSSSNIVVSDVALDNEQRRLYAAGVMDDSDCIIAFADIDENGRLEWAESSVKCGMRVVTLAVDPNDRIFAIAKQGGLYELSGIGTAVDFTITPVLEFNATGLMVLSDDGNTAYVLANTDLTDTSAQFNQLRVINIAASTSNDFSFNGNNDLDDIIFHDGNVYVTGVSAGPVAKIIQQFNNSGPVGSQMLTGESSSEKVSLSIPDNFDNFILMTIASQNKVVRFSREAGGLLEDTYRIPVQLFPVEIQVNNRTDRAYVLNPFLNTLTEIELEAAFDETIVRNFTQEPPLEIRQYRLDVVEAYSDMLSHFLQFVKDCFFSQYLIDCPTCTPDDKVYLGTVEVKNGKVHHICNFTQRHYVKSFETWEYWLSTVPILPMIKREFTKMACSTL